MHLYEKCDRLDMSDDNESLSAQMHDTAEAEKTHVREIAELKNLVEKLAEEAAKKTGPAIATREGA